MSARITDPEELKELLGIPFTPEQMACITAPPAPQVIVAGAGSGKTTVMAARVVWLVGTGQVAPERVLGLTFTNKAAGELSERVRKALVKAGVAEDGAGHDDSLDDVLGEPQISTYHAFAGQLLKEHGLRIGLEPTARLLADATRYQLAARVLHSAPGPYPALTTSLPSLVEDLLALDAELSEHLVAAEDLRAYDTELLGVLGDAKLSNADLRKAPEAARARLELLELVGAYREEKRRRDLLDFGDQIALSATLARTHPEVGRILREQYAVVLLDEYQDTSVAQRILLSSLFGEGTGHAVTAVGDPCQAIYGWRGASVANLDDFPDHFRQADGRPAQRFALSENRRSGGRLLDLANRLASPLRALHAGVQALRPARGAERDGTVRCALLPTHAEELAWLADSIAHLVRTGTPPGEIAVLCRTAADFAQIQGALVEREVPVEVVGLSGLLHLPEVADLVAVCQVLQDPTANAALVRLLTGPRWRIGPRDLALLGRRAQALVRHESDDPGDDPDRRLAEAVAGVDPSEVVSLADALDTFLLADGPDDGLPFSAEARVRFARLAAELRDLRRSLGDPLMDVLHRVLATTGLEVELSASPRALAARRRETLGNFLDVAASFAALDGEATLLAFLGFLRTAVQHEKGLDNALPGGDNTVKVLTAHKSKGLEWDVVAVPGLVARQFPSEQGRESWTSTAKVLPHALRGDAATLPEMGTWDSRGMAAFKAAMKDHQATEELRLGYVTFTRPRSLLLGSGHWWGPNQKKPRGPSAFLEALREHCEAGHGEIEAWAERPGEGEENPALREAVADQEWPLPLDPGALALRRRAADAVLAHLERLTGPGADAPDRAPDTGASAPVPSSGDPARAHDPDWPPPPDDDSYEPEDGASEPEDRGPYEPADDPYEPADGGPYEEDADPAGWDSWPTERPTAPEQSAAVSASDAAGLPPAPRGTADDSPAGHAPEPPAPGDPATAPACQDEPAPALPGQTRAAAPASADPAGHAPPPAAPAAAGASAGGERVAAHARVARGSVPRPRAADGDGACGAGPAPAGAKPWDSGPLTPEEARTVASWDRDLDALTGELRRARAGVRDVPLPASLSASQLLRLAADPDGFARELARPMPRPPQPAARRGTRFHAWVESRFEELPLPLLGPEELPGGYGDETDVEIADERDLAALKEAFERTEYAHRTPYRVEAPFQITLAGRVVRGRIDAVYLEPGPDGGDTYEIVDWKTGRGRSGDPLQLAVYRLAWAEQHDLPLSAVSAAFLYVRSGEVVRPSGLPGRAALERLLLDGTPPTVDPDRDPHPGGGTATRARTSPDRGARPRRTPARRPDRLAGMSDTPDSAVRAYIDEHRAAFLEDLVEWLRIPSVSADPARAADVRRSADWLAATLRETGFPVVEVWETPGAPAVFAEWPSGDPDAPTALVYGHHDVQPAGREDGWHSEPFEPEIRDGRLYARGAADDKGQVFFHTLGVRAHLAATGRTAPAVNLKLLIEGEEESGSPHFPELIRAHADRLACDTVIVSDTGMWSEDTPTVCTGMRGLTDCQIDLYGPDQDIHSGSFGGAVPNPATEAARLAAALHDDDRRVAIPGFYDGVTELTDRERELFAELPFDEAAWLRGAHSHAVLGERGHTTLERIWARPTAEVNGISGGYQGPGGKTIVPSTAQLKLSFRLVAGMDAEKVQQAVRDWVAARLPAGIRHEITFWGATRPCLTPLDHPALQSVVRAMGRAFGRKILFTREGGSGPAADLQDVLGAPVLFLGISVPSDGWHAPNEKVELDLLMKGVETAAYLWGDLAENGRAD